MRNCKCPVIKTLILPALIKHNLEHHALKLKAFMRILF